MKCDIILGRDILKELGFTIAKWSDEKDENSADEILNIEVSEATEIDTLDVNPNLPHAIKNKLMEKIQANYLKVENRN